MGRGKGIQVRPLLQQHAFWSPPGLPESNDNSGYVLRALKIAQPLLSRLPSHLQTKARQCNSSLPLGLRSKHFSMPHHSAPQRSKTNGVLPFIFFAHTALFFCYLVNPCLSFRIQLRGHLFLEHFFDPYCSTLLNWIRCPSQVLICCLLFKGRE